MDGIKEIPLTQGMVAIVDADDYEWLNKITWHARYNRNTYYAGSSLRINGKQKNVLMHRLIMNVPLGIIVDHIDRNGLNNQKHNLRIVNVSENARNSKLSNLNKSGFRGVCWNKKDKKWRASYRSYSKTHFLGNFDDPIEAAMAYDNAIKSLNDKHAQLNFPEVK